MTRRRAKAPLRRGGRVDIAQSGVEVSGDYVVPGVPSCGSISHERGSASLIERRLRVHIAP